MSVFDHLHKLKSGGYNFNTTTKYKKQTSTCTSHLIQKLTPMDHISMSNYKIFSRKHTSFYDLGLDEAHRYNTKDTIPNS